MLREYGFGEIEYKGKVYSVEPTFKNIDKLGDEKSISDISAFLFSGYELLGGQWLESVFDRAKKVIKACCRELPDDYFQTHKVLPSGKYKPTSQGQKTCMAIIQVARHCFIHGIVSGVKAKRSGSGKEKPFNVAEYVRSAMMIFDISREEAANMTMTEFVSMCNDKLPDVEEGVNLSGKEKRNLILEQMERDKKNRGK